MSQVRARSSLTISLIGALIAAFLVVPPAAQGLHDQLIQREQYVTGNDFVLACDALGTDLNVGGVCFELTGQERKIGIHVHDKVLRTVEDVEQDADGLLDDAADTGRLVQDTARVGPVNGIWQMEDDSDNVLAEGVFCNDDFNLLVPQDATEVRVLLAGPVTGNSLLAREVNDRTEQCDTPYHGATIGTVGMTIREDP